MSTTTGEVQRTLTDIVLKTISIRVASTMVAGHLTSLQHKPRSVQNYYVLGFLLLPSFPIATLVINTGRACYHGAYSRSSSFFFSAILGQRAMELGGAGREDATSWEVLSLDYDTLVRERGNYDLRWLGRVVVLGAFLAQAIAGQCVAFERFKRGLKYIGTFDGCNTLYLLGGTVAAVESVFIHACNWTWRCRTDPSLERQEVIARDEPSAGEFLPVNLSTTGRTVLEIVTALLMAQGFLVPGWRTVSYVPITFFVKENVFLVEMEGLILLCFISFFVGFLPVSYLFPVLWDRQAFKQRKVVPLMKATYLASMWLVLLVMLSSFVGEVMGTRCSLSTDDWRRPIFWKDPKEGGLWTL